MPLRMCRAWCCAPTPTPTHLLTNCSSLARSTLTRDQLGDPKSFTGQRPSITANTVHTATGGKEVVMTKYQGA